MAPKVTPEYTPGSIVFAKLRGYPWWPARVEDDTKLPSKVKQQKSKTKGPMWTVFFFGSKDYGFFGPDSIRPFDRSAVERDLQANKFKTKDLTEAVKQALDPTEFDKEIKKLKEAQRKEEEGGSDEKNAKSKKKAAPTKKAPSPPAKKTPVPKAKPAPTKAKPTPVKATKPAATEKQPAPSIPATTTLRKRRGTQKVYAIGYYWLTQLVWEISSLTLLSFAQRITEPTEEPKQKTNGKQKLDVLKKVVAEKKQTKPSPEPASGKENAEAKKSKKLYHLRHKLQKLVYEKKEEEISVEDYTKIDAVLNEIEALQGEVTYDILKETKIGKVMKNACAHTFPNDSKYKLKDRCLHLMKKWKTVLLAGAAEEKDAHGSKKPGKPSEAVSKNGQSTASSVTKDSANEEAVTTKPEIQAVPNDKVLAATAEESAAAVSAGLEVAPAIQDNMGKEGETKVDGDTVMLDSSAIELASAVVSQAPSAMDLGDDPTA
ncbi:hypothetical protein INT43_005474, partial [Umbelopsis isabellina]